MSKKSILIGVAIVAAAAAAGFAQQAQPDRITVPLTNPAKPAFVEVDIFMGTIKVTGYEGQEVIVEATVREKLMKGRHGVGPERGSCTPRPPRPSGGGRSADSGPRPSVIQERAEREIRRQLARTEARSRSRTWKSRPRRPG